jgi:hypothetical protein
MRPFVRQSVAREQSDQKLRDKQKAWHRNSLAVIETAEYRTGHSQQFVMGKTVPQVPLPELLP